MVAVATYGMPCAIAIGGTFLPWPNALPGPPAAGGSVGPRAAWGGALHAGVHVRLVVVADVEHVVVALEHARQAAEADVGGAAVAALRDDAHVSLCSLPSAPPQSGGDRRRVAESEWIHGICQDVSG